MKKSDIMAENALVLEKVDKFDKYIDKNHSYGFSYSEGKRLRSCNARVIDTDEYYVLISYRTVVAFIEKATNTLVDVLRYVYGYTSTSAQHISKFNHDYCDKAKNYWGCTTRLTYRDI